MSRTKPVSAAELLAAIDKLAPAPGNWQPTSSEPGDHNGLLDPVAVLTASGGDAEALRVMCRSFQIYLPVRMAEVREALRAEDSPRLREAAHKLCALLFEFSTTAGNLASSVEDFAAEGRLEGTQPLLAHLPQR